MGCFDTLSADGFSSQVKCFRGALDIFRKGDRVPTLHNYEGYEEWPEEDQINTYTIVLPGYASHRFALIKDRTFMGFTHDTTETVGPYVAKWGERLDKLEDFKDFYTDLVRGLTSSTNSLSMEEKINKDE